MHYSESDVRVLNLSKLHVFFSNSHSSSQFQLLTTIGTSSTGTSCDALDRSQEHKRRVVRCRGMKKSWPSPRTPSFHVQHLLWRSGGIFKMKKNKPKRRRRKNYEMNRQKHGKKFIWDVMFRICAGKWYIVIYELRNLCRYDPLL